MMKKISKKLAHWVLKDKSVEVCQKFIAAVLRHSMSYLNTILTMDEILVSLRIFETTRQPKRWIKRGQWA